MLPLMLERYRKATDILRGSLCRHVDAPTVRWRLENMYWTDMGIGTAVIFPDSANVGDFSHLALTGGSMGADVRNIEILVMVGPGIEMLWVPLIAVAAIRIYGAPYSAEWVRSPES